MLLLLRRQIRARTYCCFLVLLASRFTVITGNNNGIGIHHPNAAMGIHSRPKQQAPHDPPPDLNESSWYQRYPSYPDYCSIPESMKDRAIPPLRKDYRVGDTRLVHVTSVIRHGARTPTVSGLNCWDGYDESPLTSVWNCNLTTFLAPPLVATGNRDIMFMFEKKYDALHSPPLLVNELNGTCQVGQLLLRGYVQEIQNGQHLRNAYAFDGSNMQHDVRMRLLDLSSSNTDGIPPYRQVRYRSDDDQRTLMSGQIVLRALFGEEFVQNARQQQHGHAIIPLHTADRSRDIMTCAEHMCPRLQDLRIEAEESHEYKALIKSEESVLLDKFIKKELGPTALQNGTLDCIMTTMCTDRPLPEAIDDYGRNTSQFHEEYGDNLLQRIADNYIQTLTFHVTYNDGAYAKLGMGPLWTEIVSNIQAVIDASNYDRGAPPPNKLALFSGHDTTIIPLLVSLGPNVWDGEWPPYASMMIIEIHEFIDGKTDRTVFQSDFAFRLLMNGRVLTSKMEGCPQDADLCDVQVLLDRITSFATTGPDRDCDSRIKQHPVLQEAEHLLSTTGGLVLVAFVIFASGLVGSGCTIFYMTRRLPCRKRRSPYEVGMAAIPSSDDGSSSYHDQVEDFRDEPDNDIEDNVQLKTVAALVE